MSYTKGPWRYDEDSWIIGPNYEDVMQYAGCGSHEAQIDNPADKTLILAAPELLRRWRLSLRQWCNTKWMLRTTRRQHTAP